MGNGAKIGLVGVLALIVLVVAIWDRSHEERPPQGGLLGEVAAAPGGPGELVPRVRNRLEEPPPADRIIGQIDGNGPLVLPSVHAGSAAGPAASGPAGIAAAPPPAPAPAATPSPPQDAPPVVPGPSGAQRPGGAPAGDAIAGRSSPAQSQGAPAAASSKGTVLARHAVQPGDTLSRIAAQHYGDARLYHRIVEANRDKLRDPDVLPLGVVLEIPAPPAQPAAGTAATATASPPGTASTPSGRIHVVQPGDTLYRLAAHYLGSGTAYTRIYEANRDQMRSPNDLRVGMRIVIPEG